MNWGLVGASTIASEYVIGAIRGQGDGIVTVPSGDPARGAAYAERHGIPASAADLAGLLATPGVDAAYVEAVGSSRAMASLQYLGLPLPSRICPSTNPHAPACPPGRRVCDAQARAAAHGLPGHRHARRPSPLRANALRGGDRRDAMRR